MEMTAAVAVATGRGRWAGWAMVAGPEARLPADRSASVVAIARAGKASAARRRWRQPLAAVSGDIPPGKALFDPGQGPRGHRL